MSHEFAEPKTGRERRTGRRAAAWLTAALVGATSLVVPLGSPASAACSTASLLGDVATVDAIEAAAQQDFLVRLNDLRRSKGRSSLAWNGAVTTHAISWSQTMAAQNWLHHARDVDGWGGPDGVEPPQDYVTINSKIVSNWSRLAENVGVSYVYSSCTFSDLDANVDKAVASLHQAFVNSSGHYANMVGDYNQVGIGLHVNHEKLWVTVRFAKGDLPTTSTAQTQFTMSSSTSKYIDAAYQLFARRTPSSSEKAYWAPSVQSGARSGLTTALARSEPWAGQMLDRLYREVLGRSPDAAGKQYWMDQIARGYPLEKAAVELYGSVEYLLAHGGTNASFVRAIYADLLDRSADSSGLAYWKGHLDSGRLTRSGVAYGFYQGIESRRDRVSALHERIFGYGIAGSARDAWADRLGRIGDVALAAEFAASNTYWSMVAR